MNVDRSKLKCVVCRKEIGNGPIYLNASGNVEALCAGNHDKMLPWISHTPIDETGDPAGDEVRTGAEIIMPKEGAEIQEVGRALSEQMTNDNVLRIYCTMFPRVYMLQIRTHKPITGNRKGKPRNMIAHLQVTIEEMEYILQEMRNYRDGKPSQFENIRNINLRKAGTKHGSK